ncbi:MAG: putative ATP-dependent endonuclease of OLD family [Neolewinella sp.]
MKIREISWSNYRRLPGATIAVRDHLVLVGPNDTGKSSVVRAVNLCIGMAHGLVANAVTVRDFTDPAKPVLVTVTLDGIDDKDRAAFPDEIDVGPPEVLRVAVEATLDPADPELIVVRRHFPDAGHGKAPSREQLKMIAFRFVPAARSLLRELGTGSGGAVRSLLAGLDLEADAAALQTAADGYKAALDGSTVLGEFRNDVADALSNALPTAVTPADVRLVAESELLDDPLSGVTVTLKDGGHDVSLADQSDGIRAVAVLTLLGMSHAAAQIVAVDEPETHLHPTAQRSVARSLVAGTGQRVLVTHSPSVVSEVNPLDLVAFRPDRQARQLPPGHAIASYESLVRHWSNRLIEPLTARSVLAVEGPSDRIVLGRVAELTDVDLDRLGIAVFDLDGAKLFPFAYDVFGPGGFDLKLAGLVDEDARAIWAGAVGVAPADLETKGYVVCDPDLEGVYIDTLGVGTVIAMLLASPQMTEASMLTSCRVSAIGNITRDLLWEYCKRRKVYAALAVAAALTAPQAASLAPLVAVLALAV